jgi:hypothetical protein
MAAGERVRPGGERIQPRCDLSRRNLFIGGGSSVHAGRHFGIANREHAAVSRRESVRDRVDAAGVSSQGGHRTPGDSDVVWVGAELADDSGSVMPVDREGPPASLRSLGWRPSASLRLPSTKTRQDCRLQRLALGTTTDQLLFEPHERQPDNALTLALTTQRLDQEGREHLKATLEGLPPPRRNTTRGQLNLRRPVVRVRHELARDHPVRADRPSPLDRFPRHRLGHTELTVNLINPAIRNLLRLIDQPRRRLRSTHRHAAFESTQAAPRCGRRRHNTRLSRVLLK